MESFEPLINVLTLLTVLSVLSERWTNMLKLRKTELRTRKLTPEEEKRREYAISGRSIAIGIAVALLVKADLFEIMSRMDEPWKTLGWVHVENYRWMRSAASNSVPGALYAVAGCIFTGVALGFGSKFWHDLLGAVYEVRDMTRIRNTKSAADSGGAVAPRTPPLAPPSAPSPAPAGGASHA